MHDMSGLVRCVETFPQQGCFNVCMKKDSNRGITDTQDNNNASRFVDCIDVSV
jgi:hypothetical protein